MPNFKVRIPKEHFQILDFQTDNLPGVAVINSALKTFEPKIVFNWHLSILLDLEDLVDNGMPSRKEMTVIDNYGDFLDDKLKDPTKQCLTHSFSPELPGIRHSS